MEEDILLYIKQDHKASKIKDNKHVEVKCFGKRSKNKQQNQKKWGTFIYCTEIRQSVSKHSFNQALNS